MAPRSAPPSPGPEALKQAAWYAAAFGATAGLAPAAGAQVVYTDIDDVTVQNTFLADGANPASGVGFDFDGDEDDEIIFAEATNGPFTFALLRADNEDTDADAVSAIIGQFVGNNPGSNIAYFAPLEAGYLIPDSAGPTNQLISDYRYGTFTYRGANPFNFAFGEDQFIGFQLTLDSGTTHNAWMRIAMIEGGGLIVKDYAFNATPDASIAAGEGMSTANEGDLAVRGYAVRTIGANPFSATGSRLQIEVAQAERVRAEVYNALGQRVEVLYDGALTGEKTLPFGSGYAPGLYVVRVTGESFRKTLKVTRS